METAESCGQDSYNVSERPLITPEATGVYKFLESAYIPRKIDHKQREFARKIEIEEPEGPWNNYVPSEWTRTHYVTTLAKHNYFEPDHEVDPFSWEMARRYLSRVMMEHGNCHVLSWDQIEKPVDTSPGYPALLGYSDSLSMYMDEPQLLFETWEDLGNGLQPYMYVFLKQEQIKREKQEKGDIRAIYVLPDSVARCQARFDQDFNTKCKRRALQNHMAVGFAPFWDVNGLVYSLKRPEWYAEKDYKRFDGTIPASVMWLIRALRWEQLLPQYKTPENERVYFTLSHFLINKELIHPTGEVYLVTKGNPSGQMSTSVDNCLANIFVATYTSWVVYGKPCYSLVCYGDDTIQGYDCDPDFQSEAEVLAHTFGMCLGGDAIKSRTPIGLSFCGFYIRYLRGRYVPEYKPDRIIANIWRPVNSADEPETFWAKLISATLLLWESPHREIPYSLLRFYFSDTDLWVPDADFFEQIFWGGGGRTESDCNCGTCVVSQCLQKRRSLWNRILEGVALGAEREDPLSRWETESVLVLGATVRALREYSSAGLQCLKPCGPLSPNPKQQRPRQRLRSRSSTSRGK